MDSFDIIIIVELRFNLPVVDSKYIIEHRCIVSYQHTIYINTCTTSQRSYQIIHIIIHSSLSDTQATVYPSTFTLAIALTVNKQS